MLIYPDEMTLAKNLYLVGMIRTKSFSVRGANS